MVAGGSTFRETDVRAASESLTWAAIAALDRASSLSPWAPALSPNVRPGLFFQLAFAGTEARGAAD